MFFQGNTHILSEKVTLSKVINIQIELLMRGKCSFSLKNCQQAYVINFDRVSCQERRSLIGDQDEKYHPGIYL